MLSIEFKGEDPKVLEEIIYKLLTNANELKKDIGFLKNYWTILPYFKNQESAFLYVNILHFKKYNSFKYNSFMDFRKDLFK